VVYVREEQFEKAARALGVTALAATAGAPKV
jgi:hypothetical protein